MLDRVPRWERREGFAGDAKAIAGAKLLVVSGCLNCHRYLGSGSNHFGGRTLSAEGAHRGSTFLAAYVTCPSCVRKGSTMPSFKGLGPARVGQIASFLAASKGDKK